MPSKSNAVLIRKATLQDFVSVERVRADEIYGIKSTSGNGTYQIGLGNLTCTCPDWCEKRQQFAMSDVRRLCKHLVAVLLQTHRLPVFNWVQACLPVSLQAKEFYVLNVEGDVAVVVTQNNDWVDVYALKRGGNYDRFGYHIENNRWSYGVSPKNAMAIKQFIRATPAQPSFPQTVTDRTIIRIATPLPDVKFTTEVGARKQRRWLFLIILIFGLFGLAGWYFFLPKVQLKPDIKSKLMTMPTATAAAVPRLSASIPTPTSQILKFRDYPAAEIFTGENAAPVLSSDTDKKFRSRIIEAAKNKPNFAGHYIVSVWGCGAECLMGIVVDAQSGEVHSLPTTVCCWGAEVDDKFKPLEFRLNSNLLILSGERDEKEGDNGSHFYTFENGQFVHLQSLLK